MPSCSTARGRDASITTSAVASSDRSASDAARGAQVEGDAALAAVEEVEEGRWTAAGAVGSAGRLHLDHVGPGRREQRAAQGTRPQRRQLDHPHVRQVGERCRDAARGWRRWPRARRLAPMAAGRRADRGDEPGRGARHPVAPRRVGAMTSHGSGGQVRELEPGRHEGDVIASSERHGEPPVPAGEQARTRRHSSSCRGDAAPRSRPARRARRGDPQTTNRRGHRPRPRAAGRGLGASARAQRADRARARRPAR